MLGEKERRSATCLEGEVARLKARNPDDKFYKGEDMWIGYYRM